MGSTTTIMTSVALQSPSSFFGRSQSTPELKKSPPSPLSASGTSREHNSRTEHGLGLTESSSQFLEPSFSSELELDLGSCFGKFSPTNREGTQIPQLASPSGKTTLPFSLSLSSITANRTNFLFQSKKPSKKVAAFPGTSSAGPASPSPLAKEFGSDGKLKPSASPSLQRSHTVSEAFSGFSKKAWKSSSRPSSRHLSSEFEAESPRSNSLPGTELSFSALRPGGNDSATECDIRPAKKSPLLKQIRNSRLGNQLPRLVIKRRDSATGSGGLTARSASRGSSVTSLVTPASKTTDAGTSQATSWECSSVTTDESVPEQSPWTRDSLWSSFTTLNTDFDTFLAKDIINKIIHIHTNVLPFLRSTANHPSIRDLSPVDIHRRAIVLQKWWEEMLILLEGKNESEQPNVPIVDQPCLMEVAALIMMRPEWRCSTTSFQPLVDRSPHEVVRAKQWDASSSSSNNSGPALPAESSEEDVRNIFVTNLARQMRFLVDSLSRRHAPSALVNFGGKACAYAFFFAPGVADVLVRLWEFTPEVLRRTADHLGLPRKSHGESEDIVSLFPPKLGSLGWSSSRAMSDLLRRQPRLGEDVSRINWRGPWVSRWKGRDSDLFFIFCKYFLILSNEFMPPGLPLVEKARSPAFALVQAQLLTTLDHTIHRQTAINDCYGPPMIEAAQLVDASAFSMPLPPTNLMRGMSENRLLLLLKDFLTDESLDGHGSRDTFVESFMAMLKAAVCKTSKFNSPACFTLCDILEEVFTTLNQHAASGDPLFNVDWAFWCDVLQRILDSSNTMSEVRVLSLIFTIWDPIIALADRKEQLCVDWLLSEATFNQFFNHWSPLVRAYYQRLLCWRICRDNGSASEVDARIFLCASDRLQTAWSHYLFLKTEAEVAGRSLPSTAPMLPAPGKRFMIVKEEFASSRPDTTQAFDSFARILPPNQDTEVEAVTQRIPLKSDGKKKWALLGKVLSKSVTEHENLHRSFEHDDEVSSREPSAKSKGLDIPPPPPPKPGSPGLPSTSSQGEIASGGVSPNNSQKSPSFRFYLAWQPQTGPMRDRLVTQPKLPGPAQAKIRSRARSDSQPPPASMPPAMTESFLLGSRGGLIQNAKNANSHDTTTETRPPIKLCKLSIGLTRPLSEVFDEERPEWYRISDTPEETVADREPCSSEAQSQETLPKGGIQPTKPVGIYAAKATYTGRALAEWGLNVFEYNSFIEKRRDEGVLGLGEMEVPALGVDGLRKLCG